MQTEVTFTTAHKDFTLSKIKWTSSDRSCAENTGKRTEKGDRCSFFAGQVAIFMKF